MDSSSWRYWRFRYLPSCLPPTPVSVPPGRSWRAGLPNGWSSDPFSKCFLGAHGWWAHSQAATAKPPHLQVNSRDSHVARRGWQQEEDCVKRTSPAPLAPAQASLERSWIQPLYSAFWLLKCNIGLVPIQSHFIWVCRASAQMG